MTEKQLILKIIKSANSLKNNDLITFEHNNKIYQADISMFSKFKMYQILGYILMIFMIIDSVLLLGDVLKPIILIMEIFIILFLYSVVIKYRSLKNIKFYVNDSQIEIQNKHKELLESFINDIQTRNNQIKNKNLSKFQQVKLFKDILNNKNR